MSAIESIHQGVKSNGYSEKRNDEEEEWARVKERSSSYSLSSCMPLDIPFHQYVCLAWKMSLGNTRHPTPWCLAGCPWCTLVSFSDPTLASTTEALTKQAEKKSEALRSGNISLRICAWQRVSIFLPTTFYQTSCDVALLVSIQQQIFHEVWTTTAIFCTTFPS